MANIRKTFNFRNGVQVDDDNLIVNPTGLVGIGTTIPTEALDVRGKIKVIEDPNVIGSGEFNATTGIITSLTVVDLTVGTANFSQGEIGVGISVGTAGIITSSTATGIVTYYGDGKELLNLPTSQWADTDVGLGYTSIYSQGAVGVLTADPRFFFQVGGHIDAGDLTSFSDGVGISSSGSVVVTGIVTAGIGFTGDLRGNIVSGLSTIGQLESTNSNVIGIVTAGIGFTGDIRGNVISGISTIDYLTSNNLHATGIVTAGIGFTGSLHGDVVGNLEGNVIGNIESVGVSTVNILNVTGNISGNANAGILTTGQLNSTRSLLGIATAADMYISGNLGVGFNQPNQAFQIYKAGIATISLVGEDVSVLHLGQRSTIGIGESTAEFRFGGAPKTVEIINGDTGDFNSYLHGGNFAGINTGSFKWIYGKTNETLAELTYKGNLGIGKESPEYPLDVVGIATFANDVYVKTTLTVADIVADNITVGSDITLPSIINGSNINANSGVSTFNNIDLERNIDFGIISGIGSIGINTAAENIPADVGVDCQSKKALFFGVGIGSTQPGQALDVEGSVHASRYIAVGGLGPNCAVDFSEAGKDLTSPFNNRSFMLPPKITTTQRGSLTNLVAGALIYNTSDDKLQLYNGSSWTNLN